MLAVKKYQKMNDDADVVNVVDFIPTTTSEVLALGQGSLTTVSGMSRDASGKGIRVIVTMPLPKSQYDSFAKLSDGNVHMGENRVTIICEKISELLGLCQNANRIMRPTGETGDSDAPHFYEMSAKRVESVLGNTYTIDNARADVKICPRLSK
jgi:hypothetical protein